MQKINEKIKIGQVGVGVWGKNLFRNFYYLKNCQVKTVCDKSPAVGDWLKSQFNSDINITGDFDDLLNDPEIQAVVVATLPHTHAEFAIKALNAGKHVFVEKPLASNLVDGMKMQEAAIKNNKFLMVGHLLLYHPAVLKLKTLIDSGEFGDLHYLYSTRVNLGQIRSEENALWSLTSHDIAVAMHLLGQVPIEVTTNGASYIRKGIEDVVFLTLVFKDRVLVHIHASWLDPHKIRKFTVVGSKKMAVFDDMESTEKLKVYDKGVNRREDGSYETFLTLREGDISIPRIDMVEPLKLECQHFINCVQNNTKPLTDGNNGLAVLKVLEAAQESLKSNGKAVKV